jgi:hypothetical protein
LLLLAGRAPAQEDWISDDGRVVTLLLAHRDSGRVDGGTLRVDRERRVLAWEGAPNEIGCLKPWQASFDDVEDVRAEEPGLLIVLRKQPKEVRLAPLPHFTALIGQGRAVSVSPGVKEALKGPDGDFAPLSGSGSSTAPTLERRALPPAVQRDSGRAVDAILDALGRGPR